MKDEVEEVQSSKDVLRQENDNIYNLEDKTVITPKTGRNFEESYSMNQKAD